MAFFAGMISVYNKAKEKHTEDIGCYENSENFCDRRSSFQADMHKIGGQKGRACIVAEGQKVFGLTLADLSVLVEIRGNFGAHGITAEHAEYKGICTGTGKSHAFVPENAEWRKYFFNSVCMDEKTG